MNRGLGQGGQMKMNYGAKLASFKKKLFSLYSPYYPILLFHSSLLFSSLHNTVVELRDGLSASLNVPEHMLVTLLSTLWWLSLYGPCVLTVRE